MYDRESEQQLPNKFHAQAYLKAENKCIFVALSNVCFEVWLLLHFQETTACYTSYEDLRKNSALRAECQKRGFDYDKGDKTIFNFFSIADINQARNRAIRMNQQTQENANAVSLKPYQLNPYTDVYKLLDAIDKFSQPFN